MLLKDWFKLSNSNIIKEDLKEDEDEIDIQYDNYIRLESKNNNNNLINNSLNYDNLDALDYKNYFILIKKKVKINILIPERLYNFILEIDEYITINDMINISIEKFNEKFNNEKINYILNTKNNNHDDNDEEDYYSIISPQYNIDILKSNEYYNSYCKFFNLI